MRELSTNFMKRAGALGAVTLIAAALCGLAPAGAATATPNADATLTVHTTVTNAGHGTASPDFFTYHVTDLSTFTDVADGIFNHNGITKLTLPAGTYAVTEDPLEPYAEHAASCSNVTIGVGHPNSCVIANVWTPATILVSTTVDNSAGGSAKASDFTYRVIDTTDNHTAVTGTFSNSGTTDIRVPDGTYSLTESALDGYVEDVSSCVGIMVDIADPGSCIVANTFDPHTTTTQAPSTTAPGAKQVEVHGSLSNTTACVLTLDPALQDPSTTPLTLDLAADAFPQPHKGDPITLTNTKLLVTTPASLLQTGVNLGIVNDGDLIPESVKLVLGGDGTKQGSHTYSLSVKLKISVKAGKAQPLVESASLPDTTWTPNNAVDPVFFSERSLQLKSTISSPVLNGAVTSIFTCNTPNAPPLIALSAQGNTPPTRGPDGGTTPGGGGAGGAGGGATSGSSTATLPVTGTSVWLWLAPAIAFIYLGLLAIGATARKRRRALNS